MRTMPEIDLTLANLTDTEMLIAKCAIKGNKEKGMLRASKPPVPKKTIYNEPIYPEGQEYLYDSIFKNCKTPNSYTTEEERIKALGAYVWRELAFCISPIGSHHCMPVCNDFNLEYTNSDVRQKEQRKLCSEIVDKILKIVPVYQKHGLIRWGKAFGMF
jgi:hypothetical protein